MVVLTDLYNCLYSISDVLSDFFNMHAGRELQSPGLTEGLVTVNWPLNGMICARGFDNRDAGVICRSMGI